MKYIVTGNIKRDGKPLKVGSIVEFDVEDGDRLVADGYLSGPSASDRAAVEATLGDAGGKDAGGKDATTPAATVKKAGK